MGGCSQLTYTTQRQRVSTLYLSHATHFMHRQVNLVVFAVTHVQQILDKYKKKHHLRHR